ncbi:fungal-specific transcription factor domain-containing protein [Schizophyllum amplum]|uniref:Fungal-specific transcription factor domain-containing protein n=1 Tax=Schizophyllum amplum TaxID=97359 RepID=A0A550CPJ3_9AGAR|nr:fungal-specific transcription factor domain-containing protein [Auriculariopsis ampla]
MASVKGERASGSQDDGQYAKLRKRRAYNQRACDKCRKKKIRCDGMQQGTSQCSNCAANGSDCTYEDPHKKGDISPSYVESLERRLERAEALLKQFCPGTDILAQLDDDASISQLQPISDPSPLAADLTSGAPPAGAFQHESADSSFHITEFFKKMQLGENVMRFWGNSSGVMLLKNAVHFKSAISEKEEEHWASSVLGMRRPMFWHQFPWEDIHDVSQHPKYSFPPDDLTLSLVEFYFTEINSFMPLLHRPTFIGQIAAQRHLTDDNFAPILLLVCAIGARFSEDPRVIVEGTNSWHSAGWQWFHQVQHRQRSIFVPPTLYDLQFCVLTVHFLQPTSAPQACWTVIGTGIRMAQDAGAHRRRSRDSIPIAEDEPWKRAFWSLIAMDRAASSAIGRPCATQEEDFDLEYPIECDDEYWDHPDPNKAWKQPPGRPSWITYFVTKLRLCMLTARCLKSIYSINPSTNSGEQQEIVAELDSSLNEWVSTIPNHLRWNSDQQDPQFLGQSVDLYSVYYLLQILVHRPFIPTPQKPSPLSFPSLLICTNAARSCIHINDVYMRRMGRPLHTTSLSVMQCGVILLLNIWGSRASGLSSEPNREMVYVHKSMACLKSLEHRWHIAGRLWDLLYGLMCIGNMPLPEQLAGAGSQNKRRSSFDTSEEHRRSTSYPSGYTDIAGDVGPSDSPAFTHFALPMHGHNTGDVPLPDRSGFSAGSSKELGSWHPEVDPRPQGDVPYLKDWMTSFPGMPGVNRSKANMLVPGMSEYDYDDTHSGNLQPDAIPSNALSAAPSHPQTSPTLQVATQPPQPDESQRLAGADVDVDLGLSPPIIDASTVENWGAGPQGFE